MHLNGLVALEEENNGKIGIGRGVAVNHRLHVMACLLDNFRILTEGSIEQFANRDGRHDVIAEFVSQQKAQRRINGAVTQHAGMYVTCQQRLATNQFTCFFAQLYPDHFSHQMPAFSLFN